MSERLHGTERRPIDLDRVRADLMVERERVRHLEEMVRLAESLYSAGSVRLVREAADETAGVPPDTAWPS